MFPKPINSLMNTLYFILMPSEFTFDRAKVFALLADDKGHTNWELCKKMKKDCGNMSRVLQSMEEGELIYKGPPRRTTNPRSTKPRQQEDPFYIRKDNRVYTSFVDFILKEDLIEVLIEFLRSKHMESIVAENGFLFAHDLIKKHLHDPEIKRIVSKEMLALPETTKYYEIYNSLGEHYDQIDAKFEELFEPTNDDPLVSDNQDFKENFEFLYNYIDLEPIVEAFPNNKGIKILGEFDFLFSVNFYRENIFKFFQKYYIWLERRGEISSGFRKFIESDSYLSPLTSYPVSNSLYLIFIHPFQRIYDDVFLLEKKDIDYFINRALTIYENFEDIIFERNKNLILDDNILQLQAKVFTYHWNVAITRFDIICDYVRYFYDTIGDKKFHLKSEGNRFYIIDLETNRQVLPPLAESDTLLYGLLPTDEDSPEKSPSPRLMDDPFGYLRPSKYFQQDIKDSAKERTPDHLYSILKTKYENHWSNQEKEPAKP